MTRIDGEWLFRRTTQTVLGTLERGGHVAYVVGGCVRNALMDVTVTDIDIATRARPDTVVSLCEAAGMKCVPTGIDHGTITVVAEGIAHEVTTFRADVETDGRRAVIRFSDTIEEDARRRDFTMNALYADARGEVTDPLGGLTDLLARRVRFIEDAATRIREDYLRILRFFRFSAWYGDPMQGFDADALAAIVDNQEGLRSLSRERVGQEIVKLLAAPNPAPAIAVMAQIGVLRRILPGAAAEPLGPLVHEEERLGLPVDPIRRLAALGYLDAGSLRLSRAQKRKLELYQSLITEPYGPAEVAYRHGADVAWDILALRSASFGFPVSDDVRAEIEDGARAEFPVRAQHLDEEQGPELGARLARLETAWIASGFSLTRDDLLGL